MSDIRRPALAIACVLAGLAFAGPVSAQSTTTDPSKITPSNSGVVSDSPPPSLEQNAILPSAGDHTKSAAPTMKGSGERQAEEKKLPEGAPQPKNP